MVEYGPNIEKQYSSANVVFLASLWNETDINVTPSIIERLLKDGKKIVVVSTGPQSKIFGRFNRFDKFVFEKNDFPSESELASLERDFFNDYTTGREHKVNQRLKSIVDKFSDSRVTYAELSDFMCEVKKKRCYLFFRQDGAKILFDYVHLTRDGSRVLGRLLSERLWLKDFLQ